MEHFVIEEYDQFEALRNAQTGFVSRISTAVEENYHIETRNLIPLSIRLFSRDLFDLYIKRNRGSIIAVLGFVTLNDIINLPVDKIIYTPERVSIVVFTKQISLDNSAMVNWRYFSSFPRKRANTILKKLACIYPYTLKIVKVCRKIKETLSVKILKTREIFEISEERALINNTDSSHIETTAYTVHNLRSRGYTHEEIINDFQRSSNENLLTTFLNFPERITEECNKLRRH